MRNVIIWGAALSIIGFAVHQAAAILIIVLLGLFLACVLHPVTRLFQKLGLPETMSVIVTLLALVTVIAALSMGLSGSTDEFRRALPIYADRINDQWAVLSPWLAQFGLELGDASIGTLESMGADPQRALELAQKLFANLSRIASNGVLVLLVIFFALTEASSLPRKLHAALDAPEKALDKGAELITSFNIYLSIKFLFSVITAVLIWALNAAIGTDFAVLLALLAFLLNFIPAIGSILAAIPAVVLAFAEMGLGAGLSVFVGYITINVILGSVVEPRVQGAGVGLSAFVVYLSLLVWGSLLGTVGALLAVPLTMLIKLSLSANTNTHYLAALLGPAPESHEGESSK